MNTTRRTAMGLVASLMTVSTGNTVMHAKTAPAKDRAPAPHSPHVEPGRLRVSVIAGDIGQRALAEFSAQGKQVRVLLDGVEQSLCETADEQRGYVVRCVEAVDGSLLVAGDDIIREIRYGHVEIRVS